MDVEVNWIAVLLAGVSSMVVGMIWYARPVFGNMWIKMANIDEKKMKGNDSTKAIVVASLASLFTAYVLAHVTYITHQFFGNSFFQDAVSTAFWLGIGIAGTTMVVHSAFEQKSAKLIVLNVGNQLVTLLVMGAIIGSLQP